MGKPEKTRTPEEEAAFIEEARFVRVDPIDWQEYVDFFRAKGFTLEKAVEWTAYRFEHLFD